MQYRYVMHNMTCPEVHPIRNTRPDRTGDFIFGVCTEYLQTVSAIGMWSKINCHYWTCTFFWEGLQDSTMYRGGEMGVLIPQFLSVEMWGCSGHKMFNCPLLIEHDDLNFTSSIYAQGLRVNFSLCIQFCTLVFSVAKKCIRIDSRGH